VVLPQILYNAALCFANENAAQLLSFLGKEITLENLQMQILKAHLTKDANLAVNLFFVIVQIELPKAKRDQWLTVLF
jgi:hypothetical protein